MTLSLVVLAPDKDIEQAMHGLLDRHQSLEIRPLPDRKIIVHPGRDPGVFHTGHELVKAFLGEAERVLVVFDRAWEGAPSNDPAVLAAEVAANLRDDWHDAAACICIDPEIEAWVWSDSPHIASPLGWPDRTTLLVWLAEQGLWPEGNDKPTDPKGAFEAATRAKRVVPSSAIFRELASTVSLRRCTDPSFLQLKAILQRWFPRSPRA